MLKKSVSRWSSLTVVTGAVALASSLLAVAPAHAAEVDVNQLAESGIVVDSSFDPTNAVLVGYNGLPATRGGQCHDRAFAAIPTMMKSVAGCSIIGASKSVKVTYSWYRDKGKVGVCMWSKGFNSRAQTTWTAAGCGTGRKGVVTPWGNVAASKQVKGMTASGLAGVQWG